MPIWRLRGLGRYITTWRDRRRRAQATLDAISRDELIQLIRQAVREEIRSLIAQGEVRGADPVVNDPPGEESLQPNYRAEAWWPTELPKELQREEPERPVEGWQGEGFCRRCNYPLVGGFCDNCYLAGIE